MAWNKLSPFMKDGMLSNIVWQTDIEWREVKEFDAELTFLGFEKGRSSVLMWYKDSAGQSYPFFMSDFDKVIRNSVNGVLRGRFRGVKRGGSYGIELIDSVCANESL